MGNKYLSEVIDFERDIAPYRLVTINAGVGSGKSSWVESVAENGKAVLSMTSRKVVADVQANKIGAVRYIELEGLSIITNTKALKGDIIFTTNAGLEAFIKSKIESVEDIDYMLDSLDLIVVDEVHSLSADAVFADSAFYVHKFLEYVICNNRFKGTIVLMSGTIYAAQWIIDLLTEKIDKSRYKKFDLFDDCKHVEPKNVYLINQDIVIKKMIELRKENKRTVYYVNRIARMVSLISILIDSGIDINDIGISYSRRSSNDDKLNTFKQTTQDALKSSLEEIDEHLHGDGIIPDKYKIVLSTSVNKEGISIMNTDINDVFAEGMVKADLVQKAGRLREGFDNFYVVYSHPTTVKKETYDCKLAFYCKDDVNQTFKNIINSYSGNKTQLSEKTKKEIIEHFEERFPFLKYNIISDCFEFYYGKSNGIMLEASDSKELYKLINEWSSVGQKGIKKWFPYSEVFEPIIAKTTEESINNDIKDYLAQYLGKTITYSDREEVLNNLNRILSTHGVRANYSAINSLLKQYHYQCNIVGKKVAAINGRYMITYIV